MIVSGRQLSIPAGAASAAASSATSAGGDVRSMIASYASLYGVDPSLALAVAWQESGFNQNMVSATGAVGVMQVEPYTADVIARELGRPINLYSVQDNIQAGVFWLSRLVSYYGGDGGSAAAAYYQGIKSIERHGYFLDTQQYVADVQALRTRFTG
jgi:soluble lytic murein transglycosylase-like protein